MSGGACAIGVDIGGTELKAALVAADGRVLAAERVPTDAAGGPEAVVYQIEALAGALRRGAGPVAGVGVGAPGPCDAAGGIVHVAPALPGWVDVPLAAMLESRLGAPVLIENDANAAALGEWRFGAGRGARDLCYVTVSTGIGGGVIAGGALLQGRGGLAAQFGHMTVVEDSPRCFCGAVGCWEAVASGSAMGWLATAALAEEPGSLIAALAAGRRAVTARHVAEAAGRGDPLALRLMRDEARHLAVGFVNLLHLFSPEMIVVGGGVMRSLGLMRADIEAAIRARAMPAYRAVPVVEAGLGEHSGMVGAAALALGAGG